MKNILIITILSAIFLTACTGSILEQSNLAGDLSQTGSNGIELEEYIPPGIQFVEKTSVGMVQEGFPFLRNNRSFNIKWVIRTCNEITDLNREFCSNPPNDPVKNPDPGFYISQLQYSSDNGTTWVDIAENLGGYSDVIQSYNWNIPISLTAEGPNFRFKLTTRNANGVESWVTSNQFFMDNTKPTITANTLKFNGLLDSPLVLQSPGVSISFSAVDNLTPIDSFCLKNSASAPTLADSCWIRLSSVGLLENQSVDISNLKKTLGWIGGSFTFYFYVKDKSGNVSQLTDDVGDEAIDTRTISYSPGKAVVFYRAYAGNKDSITLNPIISETVFNSIYNQIFLNWTFSLDTSSNLDSTSPYNIEYSTDGLNFSQIVDSSNQIISPTAISSSVDQNCSTISAPEPNSIAKCFVWTPPVTLYGQTLYFRIHVKDSSGFQYSMSTNPINMNSIINMQNIGLGLRFVAGISDGLIGASALAAKFSIPQNFIPGKFAVHEDGRIFIYDTTYGVLVISPYDGIAKVYIKNGSGASRDGVAVDQTTLLKNGETEATVTSVHRISIDYKGRLLILENTKIRVVTDELNSSNDLNGRRSVKTIVGCTTSPCYYDNSLKNTALNSRVPKQSWPNAWIFANEFDFKGVLNGSNQQYRHFTPLPNGDIYFSINAEGGYISTTIPNSANGFRGLDFRIYRPDADPSKPGKIYPLKLSGSGVFGEPYRPIADLYPISMGGLSFNQITGNPTTLNMMWQICPSPTIQCTYYFSNHNPKTGQAAGTGIHFQPPHLGVYNISSLPNNWSQYHYINYFTSRRGELYAIIASGFGYPATLSKLNSSTNRFDKILGANDNGYCPDGTLAINCAVSLRDAWVTQDNTVFFLDGYQVRMIGKDGKVVTLFGRKPADRNGDEAMVSTLSDVIGFSKWLKSDESTERIVIREYASQVYREFNIDGKIKKIAGNETSATAISYRASASKPGYFVSTNLLDSMGVWNSNSYIVPPLIADTETGDVITTEANAIGIGRMIRTENISNPDRGRMLRILGGGSGSTPLLGNKGTSSCDGRKNNECRNDWNGVTHVIGYVPSKTITSGKRSAQAIVLRNSNYSNMWQKYYLKMVNVDTGLVTHLAGNDTIFTNYLINFPDSYSRVAMSNSSQLPFAYQVTETQYDSTRDALIVANYGYPTIGVLELKTDAVTEQYIGAGDYYNLTKVSNNIAAFTHTVVATNSGQADVIYYCGTNGRFYRRVISGSSQSEINIPFPSGISCYSAQRSMEKTIDTNNNIIKIYLTLVKGGQFMIGEYVDSLSL